MTYTGLRDTAAWKAADVSLPKYDPGKISKATLEEPVWVHFGAGNIFRGFIAALQNRLLNDGLSSRGIIAVESFDYDIIRSIYEPFDNLSMLVTLRADGKNEKSIIASIAGGYTTASDFSLLKDLFSKPSLQMVSLTITEKGYALHDMEGRLFPVVQADAKAGLEKPVHVMAVLVSLLYTRYLAGSAPIALVNMDNCSHNGDKLKNSVLEIAGLWQENGFVSKDFVSYLNSAKVSFPWSMIDKITPRPADEICEALKKDGIASMNPVITSKGTYIAPFVNAEAPQYLVIEDDFPAGRPPLEKCGVYFTNRDTVNKVERMKVTTCLNPLHTALAVLGCLLGYNKISDEMLDPQLVSLIRCIGFDEGLPVVTDPGILSPRAFLDEVVSERLPNPFIPDTPQRIATDTSQKISIRFGETIKAYAASKELSVDKLTGIPLALAAWLRYLLGIDDLLEPMQVSADPLLTELQGGLAGIEIGKPESADEKLKPILSNPALFGVNLYELGLGDRVESMFKNMISGKNAVRMELKKYFPTDNKE